METETEIWIEKLEAAIARCERLPAMSRREFLREVESREYAGVR
jgi:hypothetical protein